MTYRAELYYGWLRNGCLDWAIMFIRFVSMETHEDSQVAAGIFVAASHLRRDANLPDYQYEYLDELFYWLAYICRSRRFRDHAARRKDERHLLVSVISHRASEEGLGDGMILESNDYLLT